MNSILGIAVKRIVAVLEEGLLAAIAALGEVVRNAGKDETGEASHGAGLRELVHFVNCHRN